MKLLVIAPYFFPKIGGLENYAWHIAHGLRTKYGWEIVAIAANHTKSSYSEETIEGIKIYRLPYWFKLSNTPINLGWVWDIARIIKKEKPDIVNGHTPVPFISDLAAIVCKILNIPYILTYHNDLVKNNALDVAFRVYYATLGKITFIFSTYIVATSAYYANHSLYISTYKEKIHIIPPGVELTRMDRIVPPESLVQTHKDKKIVLFVGQLDRTHQHKGLAYLIKAMQKVQQRVPKACLLVIGKGDMIAHYRSAASDICAEFQSDVDDTALVEYYKIADVVVLPSTSQAEGLGMTLLEAGACRKPVVGSRVGGIPYVIDDGVNGLLATAADSTDLGEKILQLLNNRLTASQMGEAGYKKVVKDFTWDTQVTKAHILFSAL